MKEMHPFGWHDFLWLLLVLGTAGGLRAFYLYREADAGRTDPPLRVQDVPPTWESSPRPDGKTRPHETEELIENIKEHKWFVSRAPFADSEEPTAHVAPGHPCVLGLLRLAISDKDRFERVVRWMNAGLGALTALLYFCLARHAFQSLVVATLAGLFCAAYPFWVVNTAVYDDGPLNSFVLALALLLGIRAAQTGGAFAGLMFGLTLAGLALVRAALLPFSFAALIWFLWRSRSAKPGWLCGLLVFLGFANGLAPWMVRNFQLFGEPLPVVDSMYLHLWVGNNPEATGGSLTAAMFKTAPADELRTIKDQSQRYAKLADTVRESVRDQPVKTLQRRFKAGLYFFFGERWLTSDELPDGYLLGALLVLFPLAFLGWRWTFGWRKESVPLALAMIWIPLPYLLSHAEGLHGPRLPLDGVLLTYAAFALCCLIPGVGGELLDARPEKAAK